MPRRPVVLIIMDGWGERPPAPDNAIALAGPKSFYALRAAYPATSLACSGLDVGLPDGQMGNSEVGHLNIGAGRIVYQDITRISKAIEDGDFFRNPQLLEAMESARRNDGALHLMGLLSDGGVHSHITHIFALLEMARRQGLKQVFVHAYLDGRDVPPQSALEYITLLEKRMQELNLGRIASVGGRYWGMDRDRRWDRVEKAYRAIVCGEGPRAASAAAAVQQAYEQGITDEFVEHTVIDGADNRPVALVRDGDSLVFFNFRADRARQITRAFTDEQFDGFAREGHPEVHFTCMTSYDVTIKAAVAFPPQNLVHTLGEYLAARGARQLRIAETEKYAHLTFFFNGGIETPNPGEDRILVPSPRVATYDLEPQMSAAEITGRALEALDRGGYEVIMINYANPDMVGHTGVLTAAVEAVRTVDACVGQVVSRVLEAGGAVIITADHGNAEQMSDGDRGKSHPHTAHTVNRVPFVLVSPDYQGCRLRGGGSLQDVAPTLLQVLGWEQPPEMTGKSLLES